MNNMSKMLPLYLIVILFPVGLPLWAADNGGDLARLQEIANGNDPDSYTEIVEYFQQHETIEPNIKYDGLKEISIALAEKKSLEGLETLSKLLIISTQDQKVFYDSVLSGLIVYEQSPNYRNQVIDLYGSRLRFTYDDAFARPEYRVANIARRLADLAVEGSSEAQQHLLKIVSGNLGYRKFGEFAILAANPLREARYSDGILEVYNALLNNETIQPATRNSIAKWFFHDGGFDDHGYFGYDLEGPGKIAPEFPSVEDISPKTAVKILAIAQSVLSSDYVTPEVAELIKSKISILEAMVKELPQDTATGNAQGESSSLALGQETNKSNQTQEEAPTVEKGEVKSPESAGPAWALWGLIVAVVVIGIIAIMILRRR